VIWRRSQTSHNTHQIPLIASSNSSEGPSRAPHSDQSACILSIHSVPCNTSGRPRSQRPMQYCTVSSRPHTPSQTPSLAKAPTVSADRAPSASHTVRAILPTASTRLTTFPWLHQNRPQTFQSRGHSPRCRLKTTPSTAIPFLSARGFEFG